METTFKTDQDNLSSISRQFQMYVFSSGLSQKQGIAEEVIPISNVGVQLFFGGTVGRRCEV